MFGLKVACLVKGTDLPVNALLDLVASSDLQLAPELKGVLHNLHQPTLEVCP